MLETSRVQGHDKCTCQAIRVTVVVTHGEKPSRLDRVGGRTCEEISVILIIGDVDKTRRNTKVV